MKKSLLLCSIILSLLIIGSKANAQNSDVNATVNNPVITSAPTPTPTGTLTPTPAGGVNPSLVPSGKLTPAPTLTPTPGPNGSPTPTPEPGAKIYLDLSGFISPFASVIMSSDGEFIRSVTADSEGNFFISQVEVEKGFSSFCLEGIDFKRVGDSYTCFKIPPVTASRGKSDIFLPPTIGLSARKITSKASAFSFGYTMPEASVSLHISGSIVVAITADGTGFYKFEIKNLPVGTYELFATATYQKKDSEKPSRTLELKSLSEGQGLLERLKSFLIRLFTWLVWFFNKFGWIVIPAIILIIILLSKRLRDKIRRLSTGAPEKETKLHHGWLVGY